MDEMTVIDIYNYQNYQCKECGKKGCKDEDILNCLRMDIADEVFERR